MGISDHMLHIEKGRYNKTAREQRICQYCDQNKVEDEEHFFLHCPYNKNLRVDFISKVEQLCPQIKGKSDLDYIMCILSCCMQLAAPFIEKSLALRRVDSTTA